MAQPIFEEHPLEEYLREIGDGSEVLPGGTYDFTLGHHDECHAGVNLDWIPRGVLLPLETLYTTFFMDKLSSAHPNPFGERFKYDVISSSLLSSSLMQPQSTQRGTTTPFIPGIISPGQKPTDEDKDARNHFTASRPVRPPHLRWLESLAFGLAAILFGSGCYFVSFFLFFGTLYYIFVFNMGIIAMPNVSPSTLETLNDLIAAGSVWDSVIHEAITLLEHDERDLFYGPTAPSSPPSALRVALQWSLHTTQTQCDNVRQLFSALAAPSELSQLVEMYAPPSPIQPSFTSENIRPLSHPVSGSYSPPSPSLSHNKRSTWNGPYASFAPAGSPSMQATRREKRNSDLAALSKASSPSRSAPGSPTPVLPLSGVEEEDYISTHDVTDAEPPFGIEALSIQRKRRSAVHDVFGPSSPRATYFRTRRGLSPPSTISSASRFTSTLHTTRHPLSLSALYTALQGAIASRRYACSHLLALRFDDDDEAYWENVRSVMGLLVTTFSDASSRLTAALDTENVRLKDEVLLPTESISDEHHVNRPVSFAPMPSHLSRFAAHVDTISRALNDAREHLEQCVASLREQTPVRDSHRATSPPPLEQSTALQAYERLRREIGLALRECERGRERLLDIVSPRPQVADDENTDPDDLPGLGHDAGSDESDRLDSASTMFDLHRDEDNLSFSVAGPEGTPDDATSHLLMTASSRHLPPPGIEQVFEAETGPTVPFTREKSKLSREERIRLVKIRRESGFGLDPSIPSELPKQSKESWGPGGEVVQELKDVIWKVGERRRRMTEGESHPPASVQIQAGLNAISED